MRKLIVAGLAGFLAVAGCKAGSSKHSPDMAMPSPDPVQSTVTVDRAKIARYGLNVADINGLIEAAVGGSAATQVVRQLGQLEVARSPFKVCAPGNLPTECCVEAFSASGRLLRAAFNAGASRALGALRA